MDYPSQKDNLSHWTILFEFKSVTGTATCSSFAAARVGVTHSPVNDVSGAFSARRSESKDCGLLKVKGSSAV